MIKFEWTRIKQIQIKRNIAPLLKRLNLFFYDDFAIQFFDEESSDNENRFLMLGLSQEQRILIVCHCERDSGNTIRIISARKATKHGRKFYEGGLP